MMFWISFTGLLAMFINATFAVQNKNGSAFFGWLCAVLLQISYMSTHYLSHIAPHVAK